MKYLNLHAGLGGNRKLLPKWVNVTAVELDPQIAGVYKRLYPNDTVVIGDAHEYLLNHYAEFDFIWLSPPCQTHSRMNKFTRHNTIRYIDASLYQEIILLSSYFKGYWLCENVIPYYKPLIEPNKKIGRHLFWSNFTISDFDIKTPKDFTRASKQIMMDWLDIHYEENIYYGTNHCNVQILRNCVHPKIGLSIFNDYCNFINKNHWGIEPEKLITQQQLFIK